MALPSPRAPVRLLASLTLLIVLQWPFLLCADWTLVWSDEFTGNDPALPTQDGKTLPDPAKWGYDRGGWGWGNSELQFYTNPLSPDFDPTNAWLENGQLVIEVRDDSGRNGNPDLFFGNDYTSARLLTKGKFDQRYGRFEARIKVPTGGSGLWPAFWMLGADFPEVSWPFCGEIDIMEYVSRLPNEVFGTIHGPGYSGGASFGNILDLGEPVVNDYHMYAVEWDPGEIRWYLDGQLYHTATPADISPNQWVFDHAFFMILNVAIGGNFGGSLDPNLSFPTSMYVDYVRVYEDDQLVIPPTPSIDIPAIVQAEDYTDQSGAQFETTTDTGGGLNAGYLDDGNYLEFLLNTPTAGRYAVDLRVANGSANIGRIVVSADGNTITSPDITNTGGWQSWITLPAGEIDLPTGLVTLRLTMETPGIGIDAMNLNWMELSLVKADPMADPDQDGFINLFEEAFNLDKFTPDGASMGPQGMPAQSGGQTYLQLSYRRKAGGTGTTGVDYTAHGYQYAVEVSSTMEPGSWMSGGAQVNAIGSPVDNGDGSETVTVRSNAPIGRGTFLRLKVTETSP